MAIGRIDRVPAASAHAIRGDGKDSLIWDLDVVGDYTQGPLGSVSIRTKGDLATGRLIPLTLAIGEPLEK